MKLNGLVCLTMLHPKYKLLVRLHWHPLICLFVARSDQDSLLRVCPALIRPYRRAKGLQDSGNSAQSQRGRRTQPRGLNSELYTQFVGGKSPSSDLPDARIHSLVAIIVPPGSTAQRCERKTGWKPMLQIPPPWVFLDKRIASAELLGVHGQETPAVRQVLAR
jgi:hypothetical protein